jgi:hypothetical protein
MVSFAKLHIVNFFAIYDGEKYRWKRMLWKKVDANFWFGKTILQFMIGRIEFLNNFIMMNVLCFKRSDDFWNINYLIFGKKINFFKLKFHVMLKLHIIIFIQLTTLLFRPLFINAELNKIFFENLKFYQNL